MLVPLTDRQKQIYDFLSVTVREKGYAPSIPEIGKRFKITSTRGVFDHLKALEKKGYLEREDLKSRALRPISSTFGGFGGAGPSGSHGSAGSRSVVPPRSSSSSTRATPSAVVARSSRGSPAIGRTGTRWSASSRYA